MRTTLFTLLTFALLTATAFARPTSEQYWKETGLGPMDLRSLGYFSQANCTSNALKFRGCVYGLNALAERARVKLRLVPAALVGSSGFEGQAVKSFDGLALVPFVKDSAEGSLRSRWEKVTQRRDRLNAEIARMFTERVKSDFSGVFNYLSLQAFHDGKKNGSIVAATINAYLRQSVDAHARISPRAEVEDRQNGADEKFSGVGVTISSLNEQIIVRGVNEGSPGAKAGIKPNDVILKVDGQALTGLTVNEATTKIRGPKTSKALLRILRNGQEIDVPVVRDTIVVRNVRSGVLKDMGASIGHITLRHFNDNEACDSITAAIGDLEEANVTSLILDLRGNGGGLLRQAICIGEIFAGDRTIVQVKDLRTGGRMYPESRERGTLITNLPLVVLIDGQSASASELVAAALQDYHRAWIVGERSFGKGTVQSGDPFNSRILLFKTTQRFYSPLGRTHQLHGVEPDLTVPFKPDATDDERFTVREADEFPNALATLGSKWKQTRPEKAAELAACVKGLAPEAAWKANREKGQSADYQLISAQAAALCARRIK